MARIDALTISINGRLDPSLLAAIQRAETQLKLLGASSRTTSAVMSRIYKDAFDGGEKVIKQTSLIQASMQRIAEISAGVSIGQGLISGLEAGAGLVEKMVSGMMEFSRASMDAASSFELLSKGMGALLRDQGFANQLLEELQTAAYKSPFQLTQLGGVARELTGRGMEGNRLYGATTALGDITAGVGGGQDILERLSLAYGEAFDQEAVDKRIMRQFTQAGVPIYDAMLRSMGMDPKKPEDHEKLLKMIHDKKVSFADLDKTIYSLTHDGGLFEDAMLHFSQTFKGLLTTFEDMWQRFERDFGDIINDWVGELLKFVNNSGVWDEVHDWFVKARQMSDSVRVLALGLHESFPAINQIFGMFDKFNAYIQSFYTSVDIQNSGSSGLMGVGGGSRQWVLNTQGRETIGSIIDKMAEVFNKIMDFMTGDAMQRVLSWTGDKAMEGLKLLFRTIEEMVYLMDDLIKGDLGKFAADFKKYEIDLPGAEGKRKEQLEAFRKYNPATLPWDSGVMDVREQDVNRFGKGAKAYENAQQAHADATAQTTESMKLLDDALKKTTGNDFVHLNLAIDDATQKLIEFYGAFPNSVSPGGVGSYGANYGLHGSMSDKDQETYYEHPDTEGRSSQVGPRGNILKYNEGIGIGQEIERKYNAPFGSWVKVRTPNGRVLWRQVNERSARPHGIEYVTPHTDESSYGEGRSEILEVRKTKPDRQSDDSTIEEREKTQKPAGVTMNFHIHAIDSDSFASTVHKHAETIAEHVHRVLQSDWERAAVV